MVNRLPLVLEVKKSEVCLSILFVPYNVLKNFDFKIQLKLQLQPSLLPRQLVTGKPVFTTFYYSSGNV